MELDHWPGFSKYDKYMISDAENIFDFISYDTKKNSLKEQQEQGKSKFYSFSLIYIRRAKD